MKQVDIMRWQMNEEEREKRKNSERIIERERKGCSFGGRVEWIMDERGKGSCTKE